MANVITATSLLFSTAFSIIDSGPPSNQPLAARCRANDSSQMIAVNIVDESVFLFIFLTTN